MKTILSEAAELLSNGISFVYAVVISQEGSAPRGTGTKMLVLPDRIIGTIGGGAMEARVIESARSIDGKPARIETHDLTEKSGFLCGGICEVLIAPISHENPGNIEVFKAAAKAEAEGKRAWLMYVVDQNKCSELQFQIALSIAGEGLVGQFIGNDKFKKDMTNSPLRISIHGDDVDGIRYITDPLYSNGVMYLFGAGHVSRDVAKIAASLEFRVIVIDDREEYCNKERFPDCEIEVIEDFAKLPDYSIDSDSYILIITRGHAHDRTVLEWALTKEPFYLGMIGSRSKRDKTYESLMEQGVSRERLGRIMCPIGLSIGAETTAEIAVSIMAQIIACKHGREAKFDER